MKIENWKQMKHQYSSEYEADVIVDGITFHIHFRPIGDDNGCFDGWCVEFSVDGHMYIEETFYGRADNELEEVKSECEDYLDYCIRDYKKVKYYEE